MESGVINTMCRCCASEGAFKDFKSAYHWMGEEEIYADMLKECFDITLSSSDNGDEGGICEVCITQLRNASNFKKQVILAEDQFKKHVNNKLFKTNIVKVEMSADEDSDGLSGDDGFAAEFEIPIKTEVPEEPKTKKRAAVTRATTSKAKKSKQDAGETSTKRMACKTDMIFFSTMPNVSKTWILPSKPEANKTTTSLSALNKNENKALLSGEKVTGDDKEIDKHLRNIRTILLNTNATPIKSHNGIKYSCSFCPAEYNLPKDLKSHTIKNHGISEKLCFMKGVIISEYVVKLDITDLTCNLCHKQIDNVETVLEHLKDQHQKQTHTDIKNHILPFKFDSEELKCAVCKITFVNFKKMLEHMRLHNANYFCGLCNAPFVNKRNLWGHLARHEQGEYNCSYCPKKFNARSKQLYHENSVHKVGQLRNKCPHCAERFTSYEQRNDHMVQVHGDHPTILKCTACDKIFNRRCNLTAHMKRDHLLERKFECTMCDKTFFRMKELKCHMLKHSQERKFTCNVCGNAYKRKYTLKEHMRIHDNDKRFKCEHCGDSFIQKCNKMSHIRSKHKDLLASALECSGSE